jgi:predicted nuclease with RNAse H fold
MIDNLYVGLDPSASSVKPSGICVLNQQGNIHHIGKWSEFSEISDLLESLMGTVRFVAIDGPIQLPHELDLCCFSSDSEDCKHRQTTPFKGRYCEQLLLRRGFRCYLTSRNSFAKKWVQRCYRLNSFLKGCGFQPIEVFPYATRKLLFPDLQGKKQHTSSKIQLQSKLVGFGIVLPVGQKVYSHDELDAVLAAITGLLHAQNRTESLGDNLDGYIIIPCPNISHIFNNRI